MEVRFWHQRETSKVKPQEHKNDAITEVTKTTFPIGHTVLFAKLSSVKMALAYMVSLPLYNNSDWGVWGFFVIPPPG